MFHHSNVFILLFIFETYSVAFVDTRNGNYSKSWLDYERVLSGVNLRIQRTYNSRTLYSGLFGRGWCSEYETRLEPTAEGSLLLTDCGAGQTSIFTNKTNINNEIQKVISFVLSKESLPENDKIKLRDLLMSDIVVRSAYALKWKYPFVPILKNQKYLLQNNNSSSYITFHSDHYKRVIENEGIQKFNTQGRLIQISDSNNNFLNLSYRKIQLEKIVHSSQRFLTFYYTSSGNRIKSVKTSDGISLDYKYDTNQEDLLSVKDEKGVLYTYQYDNFHNLVSIQMADKKIEQISYDRNTDLISHIKESDCSRNFKFQTLTEFSHNVLIDTQCEKAKPFKTIQKYIFNKNKINGSSYLEQKITERDGVEKSKVLFTDGGLPVQIIEGQNKQEFEYNYWGGLTRKIQHHLKIQTKYEYDEKSRKVSKIRIESFPPVKNPATAETEIKFLYNNKGGIVEASQGTNKKIKVHYDSKNRIIAMEDPTHNTLKFKYKGLDGHLIEVLHSDGEFVKIDYNHRGEILKKNYGNNKYISLRKISETYDGIMDILRLSQPPTTLVE